MQVLRYFYMVDVTNSNSEYNPDRDLLEGYDGHPSSDPELDADIAAEVARFWDQP